jgi:methylase of polypeptide subunit release factors
VGQADSVGLASLLREALASAGFTYEAVADLLGTTAHSALSRNETLPGLRATSGGTAAETLTRMWLLQAPVQEAAVAAALPGLLDPLCEAGMLERVGDEVRARIDVRPYAADDLDLWVASDLTPGLDGRPMRVEADHVLGISPSATTLALLTVREHVGSALDLGTGCGVQALHLASHADTVVATDVNERALHLARFNAALNGVEIDVRAGSIFEPVHDEAFDLVVSNPPFVISPATAERLVYRDSGLSGDQVVEQIVRELPRHLRPGGIAQVMANWTIIGDHPWEERLSRWLAGCDAWVVQREVLDLPAYVELWLRDAGVHGRPDYPARYDAWLAWFEEQGAQAVGFGWLSLRRTDESPDVRMEEWPYDIEQTLGPEVTAHFRRVDVRRSLGDDDLLASRLVARSDVRQETYGAPGAEDPEQVVLRQQRWMRRARQADSVEAALVGACDGDLTVAQILDALAQLLDADPGDLRDSYLSVVRDLLAEGFLDAGTGTQAPSG